MRGAGALVGRGVDHGQRRADARELGGEIGGGELAHGAADHVGIAVAVGRIGRAERVHQRAEQAAAARRCGEIAEALGERADPLRALPEQAGGLGQHVDHHDPADQIGPPRRDHHRQRAAHRMADDRRAAEATVLDIADDLVGERGEDRARAHCPAPARPRSPRPGAGDSDSRSPPRRCSARCRGRR